MPAQGRCVLDLVVDPLVSARPTKALAAVHGATARARGAGPIGAEVLVDAARAVTTSTGFIT